MKIRIKIFVSLSILIFIIMGLLGGVYFVHVNNLLVNDRFEVLENLAVNTGENVKKFMSRGYLDIQLLSEEPTLQSNSTTTEEKLILLNLVESTYGIYDDISLMDLDGKVITSTSFLFDSDLDKTEWFQKAKQGNLTISNAYMTASPRGVIVNYLSPIRDDEGNVTCVVSISFPLKNLWSDIDSITIGKEGYIYIINSFNMYVAHPDKELILTEPAMHIPFDDMTENKGIVEYLDLGNSEVVAGYCTLFETEDYKQEGWRVVVVQPKEEIFSIINQSNEILMIITFIGIIGIIAISYFLTKIIVKPISILKDHTLKIGIGELDEKIHLSSKDELADLAESFNQMTTDLKKSKIETEKYSKDLEKLLKQKDEFIYQLSHDLKTPLTPLSALLPIIQKREKDVEQQKLIDVTIQSVNKLKELVFRILELAKLNSSNIKFEMSETNLLEEIKKVLRSNKLTFDEKKIKIIKKVDKEIIVHADKIQLGEVFSNLISNSIKYMHDGEGTITISAHKYKDFAIISMEDTGFGMTNEQANQVFDEFYKVDESRHDLKSHGLGLTISMRIVEKHGGRIWVENSEIGKGTTISFTLPLFKKK